MARNFTNTKNVKEAIEKSRLREFRQQPITSASQFDKYQEKKAIEIIDALKLLKVTCSYGRASKIIAIYLKTFILLEEGPHSELSDFIHPPVDRILLTTVASRKGKKAFKKNWTELTDDGYRDLVKLFRDTFGYFNWKIEMYWDPTKDEETSKESKSD